MEGGVLTKRSLPTATAKPFYTTLGELQSPPLRSRFPLQKVSEERSGPFGAWTGPRDSCPRIRAHRGRMDGRMERRMRGVDRQRNDFLQQPMQTCARYPRKGPCYQILLFLWPVRT
jgi:hypothetical protein